MDYDNLRGETKVARAMDLVAHMDKRDRLPELLKLVTRFRPRVAWPAPPEPESPEVYQPGNLQLPFFNPFGRTGKLQDATGYLVRQPLTRQVIHELSKGVSLSIVGESQTGKSSLLWYIVQSGPVMLNRPARDFIYVSLELINSDDDFYDYVCGELDIVTNRGFRLARALRGRKIVLCVDEIEKMTWGSFSLNVRTELRGLADGASAPFTLVIASRSSLGQLFPDSPEMTSPLAGLCMQVTMPNFSLQETQDLASQYLQGMEVSLPPAELELAWQKSDGHPRRLQQALQQAFSRHFGPDSSL